MNTLHSFISTQRENRPLLLMTHVIYGYPDVPKSLDIMRALLNAGTDILEIQFPFSDPVADGPTITNACHQALENKPTLDQCLKDIQTLSVNHPNSQIVLMSYLNPLLQYGFAHLASHAVPAISGVIIPDLPIEQHHHIAPLSIAGISPIWLTIPEMDPKRLSQTLEQASGMLYCVSRTGVTGGETIFTEVTKNLESVKQHTSLPLGVGFGISEPAHIQALIGHADIAIIGSALLNAFNEGGIAQLLKCFTRLQNAVA